MDYDPNLGYVQYYRPRVNSRVKLIIGVVCAAAGAVYLGYLMGSSPASSASLSDVSRLLEIGNKNQASKIELFGTPLETFRKHPVKPQKAVKRQNSKSLSQVDPYQAENIDDSNQENVNLLNDSGLFYKSQ